MAIASPKCCIKTASRTEKVLNSSLSEQAKELLLGAKDERGQSGLLKALEKDNMESVEVFRQKITSSNLSDSVKRGLLNSL